MIHLASKVMGSISYGIFRPEIKETKAIGLFVSKSSRLCVETMIVHLYASW